MDGSLAVIVVNLDLNQMLLANASAGLDWVLNSVYQKLNAGFLKPPKKSRGNERIKASERPKPFRRLAAIISLNLSFQTALRTRRSRAVRFKRLLVNGANLCVIRILFSTTGAFLHTREATKGHLAKPAPRPGGRFTPSVSLTYFHLIVETPQANLVAGIKWFFGSDTGRFNR